MPRYSFTNALPRPPPPPPATFFLSFAPIIVCSLSGDALPFAGFRRPIAGEDAFQGHQAVVARQRYGAQSGKSARHGADEQRIRIACRLGQLTRPVNLR